MKNLNGTKIWWNQKQRNNNKSGDCVQRKQKYCSGDRVMIGGQGKREIWREEKRNLQQGPVNAWKKEKWLTMGKGSFCLHHLLFYHLSLLDVLWPVISLKLVKFLTLHDSRNDVPIKIEDERVGGAEIKWGEEKIMIKKTKIKSSRRDEKKNSSTVEISGLF